MNKDGGHRPLRRFLVRHFSRESSTGNFIPVIDGLRLIAIGSVILYHLNGYTLVKSGWQGERGWLSAFFAKGAFGVPLFFVISGFIIAHPFAKKLLEGGPLLSLKAYYTRRLTRLEPPYILNLIIIFLLLVTVSGKSVQELLPHLLASLFYLHNTVFAEHSLINGVAWSLEVECQFYLLAPLMVSVFRIRRRWLRRIVLLAAIGLFTVLGYLYFGANPRLHLSVLYYANYFLTGFLLADIYLTNWHEDPVTRYRWDLVSLVAWLATIGLLYHSTGWQMLLPLTVLGAYYSAFKGTLSHWFFTRPLIYIVGGMCYTIYLYHFFVISAVGRFGLNLLTPEWPLWMNLLVMTVVVVPPVVAVCALLFKFTEKPFMRRDWHKAAFQNRCREGKVR